MGFVSMTLTPPIRIAALVGALVATGLVAFVFLIGRSAPGTEAAAPTKSATEPSTPVTPSKVSRVHATAPRVVVTKSGFPAVIDRAIRRRGVAVVAVYMPGAAVDAAVRREARAAAMKTRAGYVAISALNESVVRSLVGKTGVLPAPSVLVIKRPGVVTTTLSVVDRETIAQAVAQARR
jgi:hypothetical protein